MQVFRSWWNLSIVGLNIFILLVQYLLPKQGLQNSYNLEKLNGMYLLNGRRASRFVQDLQLWRSLKELSKKQYSFLFYVFVSRLIKIVLNFRIRGFWLMRLFFRKCCNISLPSYLRKPLCFFTNISFWKLCKIHKKKKFADSAWFCEITAHNRNFTTECL